ncbi:undecaprenyl-diphosphatase [Clostridium acetobutylicum]|uniref:Predicted phosphatase, YWOA B.subtilis ortholog n=1 Tax=Clostridium acetobutylicum (strain ATCC 824 / DSM 792 / JCM 1419 / IAM 19013 / LMG 5710 / NBRC 13948 / NRRL B-527 / VKM B-1787 / 2291 / W) TaxID=272562 RepID=Q97GH2_CLOAB|nr:MULTISPECIES: undecaprenyl-diphosphatase [Clostridium]AAK80350.1 Predicted phosphatase, YWOA B.subtilis ortholog [Clostridium acetobutylicum ATCC 824]ADZ21447.1 phosphatase [Clostridium acetobutylicum EA 2018]AEI34503.1 phosphatase [Clostridium acetobutylicum DSM 1731]AWV79229.1 undecaprenyl-diphosphatase [Clostridium acetobutylicum]KHD38524.1 phosphatase [Clostridium acetobutylicum]
MIKFNLDLFHLINNLANKNHMLDSIMIFMSKYVIYIFALILVIEFALGILLKNNYMKKIAIGCVLIIAVDLIIVFILGKIHFVNRPFVFNKVHLLYPHKTTSSFPSDHAVITLCMALGIFKVNKPLGKVMILLSIIVGFSRIYVGHHYPLDVIAGFILAIISSFLLNFISKNTFSKSH